MAKKEQLLIFVPAKLKAELKIIAVKEGTTMREITTKLLMEYVQNYYKK